MNMKKNMYRILFDAWDRISCVWQTDNRMNHKIAKEKYTIQLIRLEQFWLAHWMLSVHE